MRTRVAVGASALFAVVLPLLACAPVRGPGECARPYGTVPITVSHMVERPPLSSAFACAFAGWALATFEWLALLGRASRWAVLICGLAFAAMPTGPVKAQWVAHTTLLSLMVVSLFVATLGLATALPPADRFRALAHRALCATWGVLGLLNILLVYPSSKELGLLGAFGVAACEIAAIVHMACFQLALMKNTFENSQVLRGSEAKPPAPWMA